MSSVEADLWNIVEAAVARLRTMSDENAAISPAPGKWSPKQVIGHLIDSATHNHQRFVRAQLEDELVFRGSDQDAWVRVQRHQERPWVDLVTLWAGYNRHLARLVKDIPSEVRTSVRTQHNLDEIAWSPLPEGSDATLELLLRDYVSHLEHHLRQAIPDYVSPLR